MANEQFLHPETADLLKTLDEAARRSGVSRGQAFEDFGSPPFLLIIM